MAGLVYFHGFTGSPSAGWPLLARGRSAFAPWLVGHGVTPELGPRTFEDEVERLAALVFARGLSGSTVVAYSQGARVALAACVRFPRLFSAAVLIGARAGLREETARRARVSADERWVALLEQHGVSAFADAWEAQPLWRTQLALDDEARKREALRRRAHTPAGLAHALRTLGLAAMPDLWPALPALKIPVTYVAGALDGPFAEEASRLAAATPLGRAEYVAGAGHNVLLEAPAPIERCLAALEPLAQKSR